MIRRYTPLPDGISRPLTEDNEYSHNAVVVIITGLALFLVLATLGVRVFGASKRRAIQLDDYALLAVVICACSQISATFIQAHFGWGKSQDLFPPGDSVKMEKAGYAADLLYVAVLGLSKICIMVFYQNFSLRRTMRTLRVLLIAGGVWTVASVLILGVRCDKYPWTNIDAKCAGLTPRWWIIMIVDVAFEVLVVIYPVKMLYRIQMPVLKKLMVISILGIRVILIPLSVVHLLFVQAQIQSSNPPLFGSWATAAAELHLGLSVAMLTISSLKIFIAVYEDDYGLAYTGAPSKPLSRNSHLHPRGSWSWRVSRLSRQAKQSALVTSASGPGFNTPLPSAGEKIVAGSHAIMKSIDVVVTHERVELGTRGLYEDSCETRTL